MHATEQPHRVSRRRQARRASDRPGRSGRSGFSLVDLAVAFTILAVAVGGLLHTLTSSLRLVEVNEETARADEAARRMAERIRALPFDQVFAAYNSETADDPVGVPNLGGDFDVPGLDPRRDDADGMCGRILVPEIVVAGDSQLREDFVDAALGMPRDLNADGLEDALDHAGDHVLLPIAIVIEWTGQTGDRSHRVDLLLVE